MKKTPPLAVLVQDPSGEAGRTITVTWPRAQWTLRKLMAAGAAGLTAADLPAGLALNRYIHELRRLGFIIETTHERHDGEFAGTHGRFRLKSYCMLLDDETNRRHVAEWYGVST